jgi:hypothetical protein
LINNNSSERDVWWKELRKEIENNAQSVGCTLILGYKEQLEVFDNIMIMSVTGTAIKIKTKSMNLNQAAFDKQEITNKTLNRLNSTQLESYVFNNDFTNLINEDKKNLQSLVTKRNHSMDLAHQKK